MIKLPRLKTTFSRNVFLPGLIVLLLLSVVCALFPEATEIGLKRVQGAIYTNLHWMYSLMVTFFLIFQLILAFSKLGDIRLGADNSEPQYGFFSWIAMLFDADVLREYERYLSIIADEEKSMIFTDKNRIVD